MAYRPCNPSILGLDRCQYGELTTGTRCTRHEAQYQRSRGTTTQRGYGTDYQQQRKALIARWVQEHGWWCPGHGVPAHGVEPGRLTADHVTPVSRGGVGGPLRVMCLACNVRRGAGRILGAPTPP